MLKKLNNHNSRYFINDIMKTVKFTFNSQEYTNQMFKAWKENPSSVHEAWNTYFKSNDLEKGNILFKFQM